MDFFIYLLIVLVIVWVYVLFFKKEPKENLDIDYSKKNEVKKPLSRETLKNINQNMNYSNTRVKNTFFDLPCHDDSKLNDVFNDDLIVTRVVGVSHKNDDNVERQEILKYCYKGEKIVLEYDYDNKFSKYAIKVCRSNNGEQIGYLEDSLSKKIYKKDLSKLTIYIDEIIGGTEDKPNLGCLIEIQFS